MLLSSSIASPLGTQTSPEGIAPDSNADMTGYVRSLTGIITVGVFGAGAGLLWPTQPMVGGVLGLLAVYRLVMIYREWPRE